MPKYTFTCDNGHSEQKFVSRLVKEVDCLSCEAKMKRKLPTLSGQVDVNETIDSYTGIVHREDQRKIVEQRRDEYYWTVEVPRMVNSGTYGVETMLELGWIEINDKDQVQINNKPPHRR